MPPETVSIPARFNGPLDSGNGGYVSGVVGELVAGRASLCAERGAGPPRIAKRAHQNRGEDGGFDLVAHRVGHRQMQGLTFQREIERIAPDVAGRLQPRRERELTGLTRV